MSTIQDAIELVNYELENASKRSDAPVALYRNENEKVVAHIKRQIALNNAALISLKAFSQAIQEIGIEDGFLGDSEIKSFWETQNRLRKWDLSISHRQQPECRLFELPNAINEEIQRLEKKIDLMKKHLIP